MNVQDCQEDCDNSSVKFGRKGQYRRAGRREKESLPQSVNMVRAFSLLSVEGKIWSILTKRMTSYAVVEKSYVDTGLSGCVEHTNASS